MATSSTSTRLLTNGDPNTGTLLEIGGNRGTG